MRFRNDVIFVTGGAGFIGSAVIRHLLADTEAFVINIDKLTYAASLDAIGLQHPANRYRLVQADIGSASILRKLFKQYQPRYVMNLAAESHVDRSIDGPNAFLRTNVTGTFTLLQEALRYWLKVGRIEKQRFRFHHVSTDEVFGSLADGRTADETALHTPNSPYAATKAASDHLVHAWNMTYGLPTITTRSSNNYGPYQHPEKLIPHMIIRGLAGQALPVYGNGQHVRDWLHVEDHARGLTQVIEHAPAGATYNMGARCERTNLAMVQAICRLLDELNPTRAKRHDELIAFVTDRPGHDLRYGINPGKIERELGWKAHYDLETGLAQTVRWYVENRVWWQGILDRGYRARRIGAGPSLASVHQAGVKSDRAIEG
jgi:dTDP-glucose 4,6-dehydratase